MGHFGGNDPGQGRPAKRHVGRLKDGCRDRAPFPGAGRPQFTTDEQGHPGHWSHSTPALRQTASWSRGKGAVVRQVSGGATIPVPSCVGRVTSESRSAKAPELALMKASPV
jgi:hypothetical protein